MSNDASIRCIFCSNSTNFVSHLVINSLRNETVDMINSLIKATIRFCSMGGTLNMANSKRNDCTSDDDDDDEDNNNKGGEHIHSSGRYRKRQKSFFSTLFQA